MGLHFKPIPHDAQSTLHVGDEKLRLEIRIAEPNLSVVRELLDQWQARSASGLLQREDILAEEIVPLLPYVFLAEPEGEDWRYLMFGTALGARLGVEITNRNLGEIFEPDSAERLAQLYERLAQDGRVVGVRGLFLNEQGAETNFEAIHVPLLENDGRTILILGGMFFTRPMV